MTNEKPISSPSKDLNTGVPASYSKYKNNKTTSVLTVLVTEVSYLSLVHLAACIHRE